MPQPPDERRASRFDRPAQRPGRSADRADRTKNRDADAGVGGRDRPRPPLPGGGRPDGGRDRDDRGSRPTYAPRDRTRAGPHLSGVDARDRLPRHESGAPPQDWVTGVHAVLALLERAPRRVVQVLLWSNDGRIEAQVQAAAQAARVGVVRRDPPAFDDPANPQGVAVQVTEFQYADLDAVVPPQGCADGAIYLVLDSITDPRNLGAILRSAAFFGVQAVIIPQDRAAGVTPVVERIARGATAIVPVVRVVNLARTLEILQQRGVFVVGTGLEPSSVELGGYTFTPITALVLGAEGGGLRPLVRRKCDEIVRLSGSSDMQSLNVSAFATLALHLVRAQHPSLAARRSDE